MRLIRGHGFSYILLDTFQFWQIAKKRTVRIWTWLTKNWSLLQIDRTIWDSEKFVHPNFLWWTISIDAFLASEKIICTLLDISWTHAYVSVVIFFLRSQLMLQFGLHLSYPLKYDTIWFSLTRHFHIFTKEAAFIKKKVGIENLITVFNL